MSNVHDVVFRQHVCACRSIASRRRWARRNQYPTRYAKPNDRRSLVLRREQVWGIKSRREASLSGIMGSIPAELQLSPVQ